MTEELVFNTRARVIPILVYDYWIISEIMHGVDIYKFLIRVVTLKLNFLLLLPQEVFWCLLVYFISHIYHSLNLALEPDQRLFGSQFIMNLKQNSLWKIAFNIRKKVNDSTRNRSVRKHTSDYWYCEIKHWRKK